VPESGAVSGVLRAGSSGFTVEVAMLDGKTPASGASSCRLYRGSSKAEAGRWGWNSRGVDRMLKERRRNADLWRGGKRQLI